MLFYLLLVTGLFGFIVLKLLEEKRYKEKPILFVAMLYTFVCSAIALCIYLFVPANDHILFFALAVTFGGLFVLIAVNNLAAAVRCNVQLEGTYCGYNTYSGKNGTSSHSPVFEYTYDRRKYHEQSVQSASYKLLDKKMRKGETYTIYVDKTHPTIFVLKKSVQFGDVMVLLFGVLCLLTAFWVLLLGLS